MLTNNGYTRSFAKKMNGWPLGGINALEIHENTAGFVNDITF